MARYRADKIKVAWEKEIYYGNRITAGTYTKLWGGGTTITQPFGLLTGGLTLPDPRYEWEPFYGVGVYGRNLRTMIQGREMYEGSFPTVYFCHDSSRLLLEQALGLGFNNAPAVGGGSTATGIDGVPDATSLTSASNNFTSLNVKATAAPATHVVFAAQMGSGAATTIDTFRSAYGYLGNVAANPTNNNKIFVYKNQGLQEAGWNGDFAGITPLTDVEYSVHSIAHSAYDNATKVGIKAPTNIAIASTVNFRETDIQPSFTLAARMESDNGTTFDTNFVGCKVNTTTFNFEENRPVTYSMDFIGQDMLHNMDGGTATNLMKWDSANTVNPTMTAVTEQPYFFSRADIKFGETTFARFRRLSITINNQLDPRFYVTQNANDDRRQTLTEILEGRRQITFNGTIDMDDTATDTGAGMESNPDIKFLQYLLNQGFTDTNPNTMSILAGVKMEVELRRFGNPGGTGAARYDTVTFSIPGTKAGTVGGVAYNTDDIGIVLNSARVAVPGPNQVHQTIEVDGVAGSIKAVVTDSSS